MKHIFFKTAAAVIISLFSTVLTAREMPMDFFKEFRKHIENNNSTDAAMKFEGKLKDDILSKGLPREMRKFILSIEAAYEDVYIRQHDPDKAVIYAFYGSGKQKKCVQIKLKVDSFGSGWVIESYPFREKSPSAQECAERFVTFCKKGDISGIEEFVSPELNAALTVIPAGLTADTTSKFSGGLSQNSPCNVTVTRNDGLQGRLKLERFGYFWKITEIAPALQQPYPEHLMPKIAARCKAYKAVYPVPPPPSAPAPKKDADKGDDFQPDENTEAGKKPEPVQPAQPAPQPEYTELAEYVDSNFKISTEQVIRLASFKNIKDTSSGQKNINITMDVDTSEEIGEMSVKFTFNETRWVIRALNDSLVYRKNATPEIIANKFLETLYFAKNIQEASEYMDNELKKSFAEEQVESYQMTDPKITIKNVNTVSAKVRDISFEVADKDGTYNGSVTLRLEKNKWQIFAKNLPKKAKQDKENKDAEDSGDF